MNRKKDDAQQIKTQEDKRNLDDKEQQFVDDIPLKDLKIETEQEKNKRKTQDDSQSSNKY